MRVAAYRHALRLAAVSCPCPLPFPVAADAGQRIRQHRIQHFLLATGRLLDSAGRLADDVSRASGTGHIRALRAHKDTAALVALWSIDKAFG